MGPWLALRRRWPRVESSVRNRRVPLYSAAWFGETLRSSALERLRFTMPETLDIRTLSRETGVSPHTLRYYETAGLMIPVPRDSGGRRRYHPDHVRWVRFLRRLRDAGMGIAQLRRYAELTWSGDDTDGTERIALLRAHRAEVRETVERLTEHLHLLDRKIASGCSPNHHDAPEAES